MNTLVLGAGLVGGPMAIDLSREPRFRVTAVDRDASALARLGRSNITTLCRDLSDPETVRNLASDYDLVLNAVPGFMGYRTLKAVLQAGKNVVDIAFFPEDPFDLDSLARRMGVTAIVDCGVAPGISNLLVGHIDSQLDRTETVLIYVGGLPEVRHWPFEYRAVFSPIDVIAEYTRPARYLENGVLVIREALSDPEILDFPGIGSLEAFNTDGLRTLMRTIHAPNMKEKTLRYRGHIEKMAVLRAAGFFSEQEIEVRGARVRPIDVTAEILFPTWKMEEGEGDITVMRVLVEGFKDGSRQRHVYDLHDRYDPHTKTHSMARTTGYTATVAARMMAEGLYSEPGVTAPELVGRRSSCVTFMLQGLAARGVVLRKNLYSLDVPGEMPSRPEKPLEEVSTC